MPLFFQIMFFRLKCDVPLLRLLLENYALHLYKKKKKILLPMCLKVYTSIRKRSLLCIRAPRHLVIESLLCHRSRNVLSFRKVQRFMPLTERKNNYEEQRALHFSICSHCSKERAWPFRTVK